MKIKTTKTLATAIKKYINDNIDNDCIDDILLCTVNSNKYCYLVGYNYNSDMDYNSATGLYSIIKVIYKYDCYATPLYLTTSELNKIFKDSDRTFDGFMSGVYDYIAI